MKLSFQCFDLQDLSKVRHHFSPEGGITFTKEQKTMEAQVIDMPATSATSTPETPTSPSLISQLLTGAPPTQVPRSKDELAKALIMQIGPRLRERVTKAVQQSKPKVRYSVTLRKDEAQAGTEILTELRKDPSVHAFLAPTFDRESRETRTVLMITISLPEKH